MDLASDYDEKAATEQALRLSAREASEVLMHLRRMRQLMSVCSSKLQL